MYLKNDTQIIRINLTTWLISDILLLLYWVLMWSHNYWSHTDQICQKWCESRPSFEPSKGQSQTEDSHLNSQSRIQTGCILSTLCNDLTISCLSGFHILSVLPKMLYLPMVPTGYSWYTQIKITPYLQRD